MSRRRVDKGNGRKSGRFAPEIGGATRIPPSTPLGFSVVGSQSVLDGETYGDAYSVFASAIERRDASETPALESKHDRAVQAASLPRLVKRTTVRDPKPCDDNPSLMVTAYGYDSVSRRLEIVLQHTDPATGVVTVNEHAYRDAPFFRTVTHPSNYWYKNIRSGDAYQYASEDDAVLAGVAPRCPECGQWADMAHACPRKPVGPVTELSVISSNLGDSDEYTGSVPSSEGILVTVRLSDGDYDDVTLDVPLPEADEMLMAMEEGTLSVYFDTQIGFNDSLGNSCVPPLRQSYVNGPVWVGHNHEGELVVNSSDLRCRCRDYRNQGTCGHGDAVTEAIWQRLAPPSEEQIQEKSSERRQRAAAMSAVSEADRALQNDWSRNLESVREASIGWVDDEVSYSREPKLFLEDLRAAVEGRNSNGTPVIPFRPDYALNGLCRRGSGQAFGLEIEYEFPRSMSRAEIKTRNSWIAHDLFEAGIIGTPKMLGYGASKRVGYRDSLQDEDGNGTWFLEEDGTVEGEVVTSGLYDEPETWERIEKVLGILEKHGAMAGTRSGSHVHVGTGDYEGSPAAYTELVRLVNQHEDSYMRLASNPFRGKHRNNGSARPLWTVPSGGFHDITAITEWQERSAERESIINLFNCDGGTNDHVEFRLFDSSLDAGTIQAQVRMAVSSVAAAKRIAARGGSSRGKEPVGSHKARARAMGAPSSTTELLADYATTRSLLDTLYSDRESKSQAVAVLANTQWC